MTYNKYMCQEKEKQQYVTVGIVRMFIEPMAMAITIVSFNPFPLENKYRIRCCTMLQ